MGIGAYRHFVTLEHPAVVLDPDTWYCQIQSAATQVVDGQTAFFVRGRYHPGLTLETQLHFEGRTLQVQSVTDLDEKHIDVQLLCVEVVARGRAPVGPPVTGPPLITVPPVGETIASGDSVTLTVVAIGTPPLTYQWSDDGGDIDGATHQFYVTGPVTATTDYTVTVTNDYGSVTSSPVTITVGTPATIVTPPVDSTIASGESVTLTVVAAGTPPLTYQWTEAGVEIVGATSASYVTGPLTETSVYAVTVSNLYGTETSGDVTITVEAVSTLLESLVSYWSFDSDWSDIPGTNDLTNVNGVTSVAGKLGNAGDFEASSAQYLSHADPTPLGDEDFTYALWFKRESSGVNVVMLSGQWSGLATISSHFFLIGSDGRLFFMFTDGSVNAYTPTTPFNDTTSWHFVIGWHDATANTINLQVDNSVVYSSPTGGTVPTTIGPMRIGVGFYSNVESYFDGLIDEVGLWRRVLTAQERSDLYNGGAGLAYPFA